MSATKSSDILQEAEIALRTIDNDSIDVLKAKYEKSVEQNTRWLAEHQKELGKLKNEIEVRFV